MHIEQRDRRRFLLAAAAAAVTPGAFAQARGLAAGPVRIVVPFTPGPRPTSAPG